MDGARRGVGNSSRLTTTCLKLGDEKMRDPSKIIIIIIKTVLEIESSEMR